MDKDKKYCINCGREIPKTATFCPFCSAWQEDALPKPAADTESSGEGNEYKAAEGDALEGTYTLNRKTEVTNVNLTGGEVVSGRQNAETVQSETGKKKTDADDDQASQIKDLMEKAYRDELTHLYNRQKLKIDKENIKTTDICAVISIDINNLKHTNDTYGHEKGDQLINNMAKVLRQLVPDNAYRTGGDEFLVLQPGGTRDSALRLVQNITSMLDEMRENPDNGFVPVAAMGVAEKKSGETYEQAFDIADKLMYENKAQLKAKRGRRATDKAGTDRDAASQSMQERSHDGMQESNARYRTNEIRRAQDKAAERTAKELYFGHRASYRKMTAGRIIETAFFGAILILIILARARIG